MDSSSNTVAVNRNIAVPEVSKQTKAFHIIIELIRQQKHRTGFNKILTTLRTYPEFSKLHGNTLRGWIDSNGSIEGVVRRESDTLTCVRCGYANFELVQNVETPRCEHCHIANFLLKKGNYYLVSDSEIEIGLTVESKSKGTQPTHRTLLFLLYNSVAGGIRYGDNNSCRGISGISFYEIINASTFRIGNRFTDLHLTEKEAYRCIDTLIEAGIWTQIREYAEVRYILVEDTALKQFIGNSLLVLGYTTQRLQLKWILRSSLTRPESQWYQSIYSKEAVNSFFTEKVKRSRPIPEKERKYLKTEITKLDRWINKSLEKMDAAANQLSERYPVYIAAIGAFVYPDFMRRCRLC